MTISDKALATTADPSRIGGRYRIEAALAEGGMGSVYRVIDERTGQELALKRLRGAENRHMLALFEREYRTLAGIEHPRIIRAFDYGVDAAGPYYTMELVVGRDLHELSPLPFRDACRHLRDVATCLALLHTRRLLHRDITPRNVRIMPNGECKLLDFGALMSFGIPDRTVGTPPCIPPEALRRAPLDQRSDIFSFGALMYWALTRRHAYPAKRIEDLPQVWRKRPRAPSKLVEGIPPQIDAMVLGMLNIDPMARPGTIAEVVERLTMLADLPAEDDVTQRALAESYLVHASFVGREHELSELHDKFAALDEGRGSATLVIGPSGVGRSRLLDEALVQAELLGVPSFHVDASTYRQPNGTALAIVSHLLDTSAGARREAQAHASTLAQLDRELAERLGVAAAAPHAAISGDFRARTQELLLAIVTAASNEGRMLLVIDNVDEADDGSLALLASILRLVTQAPLAIVCSARGEGEERDSMSWRVLRDRSKVIALTALSADETQTLARSLFGEAPNLARFAEWLHQHTGGLPLHCMELVRRLHANGTIRYLDGLWVLPAERPAQVGTEGLSELLAQRLDALSPGAVAFAQALAVQRGALSRDRCVEIAREEGPSPFALLDELVRSDVLDDSLQGYRFTHGVLREALAGGLTDERRRRLHLRCAERALASANDDSSQLARIDAGWHLLQADERGRGADTLAAVAFDTVGVRFAFADLQVVAPALEAALRVYTEQGRSLYERLPLMAALAQAGYYEDRVWGERYGDAALAGVEEVSGLSLARKLRPWLGKTLGLLTGMTLAFVRFSFQKKSALPYRFADVLVQLFGVVTTLTGAAAVALDVERAQRVASTLEPFLHLPERLTPVGIGQFCATLKEIGRENQAHAVAVWTTLLQHFGNPRYYPTLPDQARPLYVGGLWFARGVFESFRDGRGALEAADALDRLGLKLYAMIASALRSMHYANRAQFEQARRHREQVEVHAIQIGSAWQVELWEPAAMMLVHTTLSDVVELRRVSDRLAHLAQRYPSLVRYAELAELAAELARGERAGLLADSASERHLEEAVERGLSMVHREPPRSFIGWGSVHAFIARALNLLGRHVEAQRCCEKALKQLTAEDRPFVALFLNLEIERALAEAGLGQLEASQRHLDELLVYHAQSDNPLTQGRLHEARTKLAARMDDWPSYRHHLEQARSWYKATANSGLIARIARLEALDPKRSVPPEREKPPPLRIVASEPHPTPEDSSGTSLPPSGVVPDETMDTPTIVAPSTAGQTVTRAEPSAPSRPRSFDKS